MEQEVQQAPKEILDLLGQSAQQEAQLVLQGHKVQLDQVGQVDLPVAQAERLVLLVLMVLLELLGFKAQVVLVRQELQGFKGLQAHLVAQEAPLAHLEKLGPLVQVVIREVLLVLLAQLELLGLPYKYLVVLKNHMDLAMMVICIGSKRLALKELVYG
jgi:hypothetical protein